MAEANAANNNNLPPEVLVKIFKHCSLPVLMDIMDVCQLWRNVATHQYNTSANDIVIRHPNDVNNLVSWLCKPVSFSKLHIVWDFPIRGVDYNSVSLDALDNTTSLSQLQSFMFKVEDKHIQSHSLYDYSVLVEALLRLLLQGSRDTLTHLKLINTGSNTSRKMLRLLKGCQHLTHLVLNGCDQYNGSQQRLMGIIPTLTRLELIDIRDMSECPFDLSFITSIKRGCPNISNNIMIGELHVRPSDDMSMLHSVSHVDKLDIHEFDTDQLRSLISCLNECVSPLTVDGFGGLYVEKCKKHLTDEMLLSLVNCLRGLKCLDASDCRQLTNEGVVNVITSSPQLHTIYVTGIKNINADIIQLLDRVVTSKQHVNIFAILTKLSEQMENSSACHLKTGRDKNICLQYRWGGYDC